MQPWGWLVILTSPKWLGRILTETAYNEMIQLLILPLEIIQIHVAENSMISADIEQYNTKLSKTVWEVNDMYRYKSKTRKRNISRHHLCHILIMARSVRHQILEMNNMVHIFLSVHMKETKYKCLILTIIARKSMILNIFVILHSINMYIKK